MSCNKLQKMDLVKHGPNMLMVDNGAQMSKLIYLSISCEPVICEAEGLHTPASVGDLKIVGLWEAGRNGFLDYSIVNPDTLSMLLKTGRLFQIKMPRKSIKNMIMM